MKLFRVAILPILIIAVIQTPVQSQESIPYVPTTMPVPVRQATAGM